MRKLFLVLVTVAMIATACGGSTDTVTSGDSSSPGTASTDTASSSDTSASSAPSSVSSSGADEAATCGFNEDLTADRIVVEQIPGDGFDNTLVSALQIPDHPSFDPPLVDLNRVLSGGPPPDGIPPIDDPIFQTANTVNWLRCNEPVLSLSVNGEARAYPVQIMTWHELVNDTFGEVPVTVSYCPLCNSALSYRRDPDGRVVTFGTSGRLFNSSLVMYDRETQSLWTHFNGAAVAGELVGTELELLPMQTTSWASFIQQNPEGLVLTRETGHDRRYGQNPYSGYDNVDTDPFAFDQEADPRLPAKQRIVGIRRGADSAAVVLDDVAAAGVLVTEVDGDSLSVWHLPGTASALDATAIVDGRDIGAIGVFLPTADGQALTFSRDGEQFVDAETGSSWTIQGQAVDGPLAGEQLEQVEHLDTFWFALAAFEPDTRIVRS
jgi:hypothetical protein